MAGEATCIRRDVSRDAARPVCVGATAESNVGDEGVRPGQARQRSFFLARAPGQDRSVLMLEDRTSRGDAGGTKTRRRVLVDPAQWSQRTDAIGPWSVSRDGRFVAYGVALNGADVSTVRVLNVESGKDSAIDVLPRVVWEAPQWSPDERLLYYNTLPDLPLSDPSRWLQAVMVRHEIGKPASSDLALSKPLSMGESCGLDR